MCKLHITLTEPKPTGLWDTAQLATYLHCSQRHIFNLRKRGMPSFRLGDAVRFDIGQVTDWLNSGCLPKTDADLRRKQLADLAAEHTDNGDCAAADLCREFPSHH